MEHSIFANYSEYYNFIILSETFSKYTWLDALLKMFSFIWILLLLNALQFFFFAFFIHVCYHSLIIIVSLDLFDREIIRQTNFLSSIKLYTFIHKAIQSYDLNHSKFFKFVIINSVFWSQYMSYHSTVIKIIWNL